MRCTTNTRDARDRVGARAGSNRTRTHDPRFGKRNAERVVAKAATARLEVPHRRTHFAGAHLHAPALTIRLYMMKIRCVAEMKTAAGSNRRLTRLRPVSFYLFLARQMSDPELGRIGVPLLPAFIAPPFIGPPLDFAPEVPTPMEKRSAVRPLSASLPVEETRLWPLGAGEETVLAGWLRECANGSAGARAAPFIPLPICDIVGIGDMPPIIGAIPPIICGAPPIIGAIPPIICGGASHRAPHGPLLVASHRAPHGLLLVASHRAAHATRAPRGQSPVASRQS